MEKAALQLIASVREHEILALAVMIATPEEIPLWRDKLTPDRFQHYPHVVVCETLYAMAERGAAIDVASLWSELVTLSRSDDVGIELMGKLASEANVGCNVQPSAQRVLDAAMMRDFRHCIADASGMVDSPDGTAEDLINRHRLNIERLTDQAGGPDGVPIITSVNEVLDDIDARSRGDRPSCLATGFDELDYLMCGGLGLGHVTVLAARTSVGKTAFALAVTRNVCRAGGVVFFASMEQSHKELTERNLAAVSDVSGRRIRSGDLNADHREQLLRAADEIRGWRLIVDDRRNRTAPQIVSSSRRNAKRYGRLDLVVVDYLTLIRPEDPKAPRYVQAGAPVRKFQDLARGIGVPVLLLAQLNREAADNAIPMLHHIRESGDVEQDTDAALLLHQENDAGGNPSERFRLIVAKQRNGPKGQIFLERSPTTFGFTQVAEIPT